MDTKHISHFFSLNASHELLPFFVGNKKSAAKEVTESLGIFNNSKEVFGQDFINDAVVIVPGDGKRPRTAAIFSFLSKCESHSIDPIMDLDWFADLPRKFRVTPQRLKVYKCEAEGLQKGVDCCGRDCLIVACHSHAPIKAMLGIPTNAKTVNMISMPCCTNIPENFTEKKFAEKTQYKCFSDFGIWSAKRKIHIWKNL